MFESSYRRVTDAIRLFSHPCSTGIRNYARRFSSIIRRNETVNYYFFLDLIFILIEIEPENRRYVQLMMLSIIVAIHI